MADLLYRISLKIVPRFFVGLSRIWFSTCRVKVQGSENLDELRRQGVGIAVFWHYSFAYILHHLRKFSASVMVSASRDGEYIAEVVQLMGHAPLRGSSSRRGAKALLSMVKAINKGNNAAIVGDGSRGPARILQPGCIFAASKTGKPILPIVWAADRYIAFKSWDRTVLPYPFSTIILRYGKPFHLPAELEADEVEQYRRLLEQQMNELYESVWADVGRSPHDRVRSSD